MRLLAYAQLALLLIAGAAPLARAAPEAATESVDAAAETSPAPLRRIALLIGISDYPAYRDLEGPREDLRAMREVLVNVWDFHPADVITLADGQATRTRILAEFDALMTRSSPGDHVLVY